MFNLHPMAGGSALDPGDLFNGHLRVGGSIPGCEESVSHYVFAIDALELC